MREIFGVAPSEQLRNPIELHSQCAWTQETTKMAGPGVSSPGGFSYAQAAKGRVATPTSQAPSSKLTSGAATPATDLLADFAPAASSNWADDVDLAVVDKQPQSSEEPQEKTKVTEPKGIVERAKAEEKA